MTDFVDEIRSAALLEGGEESIREINRLFDHGDRLRLSEDFLNLTSVDLHGARFLQADLSGCYFRKADLSGVEFHRSNLARLDFRKASLAGCKLTDSLLENTIFLKTDLTESDLSKSRFKKCSFSDADLTTAVCDHANFSEADFDNTKLTKARLLGAKFLRCEFGRADFAGANLAAVEFKDCEFTQNSFRNADLSGASLVRADLSGQDLSGANLQRADLLEANLTGADLTGANLAYANLDKASLVDAQMKEAVFESAAMHDTRLSAGQEKYLTAPGQVAKVEILDKDTLPGLDHSQEITFNIYRQISPDSIETKYSDGMYSLKETTAAMQADQLMVYPRRGAKKRLENVSTDWGSARLQLKQNEYRGVPLRGFLDPIPKCYRHALRRVERMRLITVAAITLLLSVTLSFNVVYNFMGIAFADPRFWPYILAMNIVPLSLAMLVDFMIRSRHPAKRFSINGKSPAKGEVLVLVESSLFDEGSLPTDAKSIWLITGVKTADSCLFYNPTEHTRSTLHGEKTTTVNYSNSLDEKTIHDSIRSASGRSVIVADGWKMMRLS